MLTGLDLISKTDDEPVDEKTEQIVDVNVKNLIPAISFVDRSFMDDDVFNNLRRSNLFKKRTSLEYYVTPSIGFRTLKQKY